MKKRLLAAAILIPFLFVVVFALPKFVMAFILALMCAIASYEVMSAAGMKKQIRLVAYSALIAFAVPLWCHWGMNGVWGTFGILAFFGVLFGEILASHGKLRFERMAVCLTAGLLVPYLLCALMRIMDMDDGRVFVMIPFVTAFLADSGAYFVGTKWGKHKFVPNISPNKSLEGVVGGIAASVLGMLIYCLILELATQFKINYLLVITYGIIGAAAGVFGDLCFSVIKRQTGVKDYGNLIPGHGGILDRFDSVIIVAPLIEILLNVLPIME